jgi:hypothetical protein
MQFLLYNHQKSKIYLLQKIQIQIISILSIFNILNFSTNEKEKESQCIGEYDDGLTILIK